MLPAELDGTYKEAMARITAQPKQDREIAERALTWITYARRPLSLTGLQHALAISPGTTHLDPEAVVPEPLLTS